MIETSDTLKRFERETGRSLRVAQPIEPSVVQHTEPATSVVQHKGKDRHKPGYWKTYRRKCPHCGKVICPRWAKI